MILNRVIEVESALERMQSTDKIQDWLQGLDYLWTPTLINELGTLFKAELNEDDWKTISDSLNTVVPNKHELLDYDVYLSLLKKIKIACLLERNFGAELHAYKLAIVFGDVNAAMAFLERYSRENQGHTKQPIHDACLFNLPSNANWNLDQWRVLCDKYMHDSRFRKRVLPNADKIQEKLLNEGYTLESDYLIDSIEIETKAATYQLKNELKELYQKQNSKEISEEETERLKEIKTELNKSKRKNNKHRQRISVLVRDAALDILLEAGLNLKYARALEAPEAATIFDRCNTQGQFIPESVFNQYLDEIAHSFQNSDEHVPPVSFDGAEIGFKGYSLCKLGFDDPKAAVLGYLTACCQSLGNAGEVPAKYGMTSEFGGFYVLIKGSLPENGDSKNISPKKIMAQCFAWKTTDENDQGVLVFDSIESQPIFRNKYINEMQKMFSYLAYTIGADERLPITKVYVGLGGATPGNIGYEQVQKPVTPIGHNRFDDSWNQMIIYDDKHPFYCRMQFPEAVSIFLALSAEEQATYDMQQIEKYIFETATPEELEQYIIHLDLCDSELIERIQLWLFDCSAELIPILVNKGADPLYRRTYSSGWTFTPLETTCSRGLLEKVKALFKVMPDAESNVNHCVAQRSRVEEPHVPLLKVAKFTDNGELAQFLVDQGANIVVPAMKTRYDFPDFNMIEVAIEAGHMNVASALIDTLQAPLTDGNKLLDLVCRQGHVEWFNALMAVGYRPETSTLVAAVSRNTPGHYQIAKFLLEHDLCDVNGVTIKRKTPLASANSIRMLKLLIDFGADIDMEYISFWENTTRAVMKKLEQTRRPELILYLLEQSAKTNSIKEGGPNGLYIGLQTFVDARDYKKEQLWIEIIEILLSKCIADNEINIEGADEYGKKSSLLMMSFESGYIPAIERLLDEGADVSYVNNLRESILHACVTSMKIDSSEKLALFERCIALGADATAITKSGDTLFHACIEEDSRSSDQHIDIVKRCIDLGVDIQARNSNNKRLLDLAREFNSEHNTIALLETAERTMSHLKNNDAAELGQILEKNPCLINSTCQHEDFDEVGQCTLLMHAASKGFIESVEILLKHGAYVNRQDSDGDNALVWALESRDSKECEGIMQLLLEAGANPLSKNKEGENVLDRARAVGASKKITQLLKASCTRKFMSTEQSETYFSVVTTLARISDARTLVPQKNIEIISSDESRSLQRLSCLEGETFNQRLIDLIELENKCFTSEQAFDDNELEAYLIDNNVMFLREVSDGRLLGAIIVTGWGTDSIYIDSICTVPNEQGKGHGKFMMQSVLNYFSELKPNGVVSLDAEAAVRPFYQSLGFHEDVDADADMDSQLDVSMSLSLSEWLQNSGSNKKIIVDQFKQRQSPLRFLSHTNTVTAARGEDTSKDEKEHSGKSRRCLIM